MQPIKILIVDDSAFMRLTLSRRLSSEPDLQVVGTAADGNEAIRQVQELRPDVVTMDVEMPGMNGLNALAKIMSTRPTPVIMVSSLTQEGAETTIRALTLGAVDFVAKPSQIFSTQQMVEEIAAKIRQAATARVRPVSISAPRKSAVRADKAVCQPLSPRDIILVIGSSTGGPGALRQLMTDLPADVNAAGVIVQHMPAGFTQSLANRLDEVSAWNIREARAGDRLMRGQILLAPGGYHLVFDRRGEASLNQEPPVNAVRPAVDVTMQSIASHFGRRVLGAVLTGMGRDGTTGALAIQKMGGRVVAEAESTCAVYGMPRSVVEAGAANLTAPLTEMAALLSRLLREPCSG